MEKEKTSAKEQSLASGTKFSKKAILTFDRFRKRRDLLEVLLKENKTYTIVEVDDVINKFMGGK